MNKFILLIFLTIPFLSFTQTTDTLYYCSITNPLENIMDSINLSEYNEIIDTCYFKTPKLYNAVVLGKNIDIISTEDNIENILIIDNNKTIVAHTNMWHVNFNCLFLQDKPFLRGYLAALEENIRATKNIQLQLSIAKIVIEEYFAIEINK